MGGLSECFETYEKQLTSYRVYGSGYPDPCGSDFISYQKGVVSLQDCQNMCSDKSSCRFVAYSNVGDQVCSLYKSQCQGQTHTTCGLSECFETYEKEQDWFYDASPAFAALKSESNFAALPTTTTTTMAPDSTTPLNSALPITTTSTMAPNSTTPLNPRGLAGKATASIDAASYLRFGSGYPDPCGSDFISSQVGVASLQACQNMCSDESSCRYVAYSPVGEQRCGLYKSQCQGQAHTTCSTSECYVTYEKEQYQFYGAGYPGPCGSDYIRNEVN